MGMSGSNIDAVVGKCRAVERDGGRGDRYPCFGHIDERRRSAAKEPAEIETIRPIEAAAR